MSKIYTKIIADENTPTVTNVLWLDLNTNTLKRYSGKGWVSIVGSNSTNEDNSIPENEIPE
jgi:hypothetical protein